MYNALKRIWILSFLMLVVQNLIFAQIEEESIQDKENSVVLGTSMGVNVCTDTTRFSASICSNSTYSFDTDILSIAGQYAHHYTSSLGCDSVVILTLTVLPVYNFTVTDSLCVGGFYQFGANYLISSGIYQQKFTASNGCDSVVTLYLKYKTPIHQVREVTICRGESYIFEGTTFSEPGIYSYTYQTLISCDSVLELHLSVTEPKYTHLTDSFCKNSSYQFFDTLITVAGTYQHKLQSVDGCDSVIVLDLIYKSPIRKTQDISICQGGSYTFVGNIFKTAGVYSHTFSSSSGCDSIVTLQLDVRPPILANQSATFCQSGIYNFGGDLLTEPGTYTHLFKTDQECDSIVTLTLKQLAPKYFEMDAIICPGENYPFGSRNLTATGTYVDTLVSSLGCDSIVTLNLKYADPVKSTIDATTCKNQPYSFGFRLFSVSGKYILNTKTARGCDSIVTLNLTVNRTYKLTQNQTIAWNEVYEINNNTYSKAGEYIDILQSVNACDSVVITNLSINYDNAPAVLVPKYFTPNGDGINDRLEIENMDLYPRAYLEIVDRQGRLLYRMKSSDLPWDGMFNGYQMPQTDYWYKLEVPETNKSSVGHFLLKR